MADIIQTGCYLKRSEIFGHIRGTFRLRKNNPVVETGVLGSI